MNIAERSKTYRSKIVEAEKLSKKKQIFVVKKLKDDRTSPDIQLKDLSEASDLFDMHGRSMEHYKPKRQTISPKQEGEIR